MTIGFEATPAARAENNAALIAALGRTEPDETGSTWVLEVLNDTEHHRWIATLGADAIGELTYQFAGGRVVLLDTWVEPAYRHNRVATELVGRALDEIRASGRRITVICPVVGEFIGRTPEYLDLIDPVHPGAGARPQHGPGASSRNAHT